MYRIFVRTVKGKYVIIMVKDTIQSEKNFLERLFPFEKFELCLAKDVYWVSFDYLGKCNYSFGEIVDMVEETPSIKSKNIKTIADAISLFVVSEFKEVSDTRYETIDGIQWEYYKNGLEAVSSNEGCCASCCAWTNFMLADKFKQFGVLGIIRPQGGHAINYFFKDDWFYFLDMNTMVSAYRNTICPQTGRRADFIKSAFITGILVKAKSIEGYVDFYGKYTQKKIPEHLFINEKRSYCCPLGENRVKNTIRHIYIPTSGEMSIIRQKRCPQLISYEFV